MLSRREFLKSAILGATGTAKLFAEAPAIFAQSELQPEPANSIAINSGFEWPGESRLVEVYSEAGEFMHFTRPPEISSPPGWDVFHKHSDDFAQPELRPIPFAPPYNDPPRVFRGQQGLQWFTFYRIHDCGVRQEIPTIPGVEYSFIAATHAWCSQTSDPYNSDCDPWQCTQKIGYSLHGDINPYQGRVVWTGDRNIYDQFELLRIQFTATQNVTTVFLRSFVKWAIKHNDLYWDSVRVVPVERHLAPIIMRGSDV